MLKKSKNTKENLRSKKMIDYSILTSAVDFTEDIQALLGIGAIIVSFLLVKNNIILIMNFIEAKREEKYWDDVYEEQERRDEERQ